MKLRGKVGARDKGFRVINILVMFKAPVKMMVTLRERESRG